MSIDCTNNSFISSTDEIQFNKHSKEKCKKYMISLLNELKVYFTKSTEYFMLAPLLKEYINKNFESLTKLYPFDKVDDDIFLIYKEINDDLFDRPYRISYILKNIAIKCSVFKKEIPEWVEYILSNNFSTKELVLLYAMDNTSLFYEISPTIFAFLLRCHTTHFILNETEINNLRAAISS